MMNLGDDQLIQALSKMAATASVLYVEDELEIRRELAEMLESLFGEVVTAEDGAAGLEQFSKRDFDLVITDLHMPRQSGLDLIQRIQQVKPQQAILVTSAYSDAANLIPLINLGVGSFALKPLNWRTFLSLVHKELSASVSLKKEAHEHRRLQVEVERRSLELQEIERRLLRLQEAKDDMLALISHEMRTPLNGILGFAELAKSLSDSEDLRHFVGQIEESARRLERSTRKAIDFTSLSTGERKLHLALHRVDSLWQAAYEQVRERMEALSDLTVHWESPREEAVLSCDGELAVEVFRNLLENIVKYAGPQLVVHLSFRREGYWHRVNVRDEGAGFSATSLERLFRPFTSGNLMHHSQGMGLGLALVDVIMLSLGGRVEARNHPLGGADVLLSFPVGLDSARTSETVPAES